MRVIGGEFRSRRLKSLPGVDVRPTPDRLREALFNVLQPRIEGAVFVDVYAGTGAVGIEAVSRGAASALFIERGKKAAETIRANVEALGIGQRCRVLQGSAQLLLPRQEADIVFIDPPYALASEYATALEIAGRMTAGLVVVQHASRFVLPEGSGTLRRTRVLKQGDNSLSFYERV